MNKKKNPRNSFRHHLRQMIVPHHANHHRPYLIRPVALGIVSLIVLSLQIAPTHTLVHHSGIVLSYANDVTPVELVRDTNIERVKAGLAPLQLNSKLNASAAAKADDMLKYGYWSHVSPAGVQPWFWFMQASYDYSYAGENLAKDFDTSAGVTQGWMNSPTHRENLLNIHYTDIGFAVANGTLEGKQTTLVVAHYGALGSTPIAYTAPNTPKSLIKSDVTTPPQSTTVLASKDSQPKIEAIPIVSRKYSLADPLPASKTLSISSELSLFLLLSILFVMIRTHFTVWRRRIIHGFTHRYKLRVSAELAIIGLGIVIIIVRSFGTVT